MIPAQKEVPGLVYPANAGFRSPEGTFVLSTLIESRSGETPYYKKYLTQLGLKTAMVSKSFEGEADFFPFQNKIIFTYGKVEEQRFVGKWGFPPWKRVYGFRSDYEVLSELQQWVPNKEILSLQLMNEAYYHGDAALCSIGSVQNRLLVYLEALSEACQNSLQEMYPAQLIPLSHQDASIYAANSFYFEVEGKKFLVMPEGVSSKLVETIENLGTEVVLVDVSEFWRKGGGSVKCMIGNLGVLPKPMNEEIKQFREAHLYHNNFS